ncbi:MAG: pitrilysin family protein [Candidatus Izemoplasmatales bacterium]|nr:pitrilysin family protein [Candidatus Izemoplasmatales bacterium]
MMEKKYILTDEIIYQEELENGLTVYIHPKIKFVQKFASLQVNFGGRDFKYNRDNQPLRLPHGTAHFLEHMLFENNGNTLSDFFIKNNADINAYTSRRLTSYYFSTQENFTELLDKLLDNFIDYNFNETSIHKELKIISQELSMSDDSDEIKAYKSLLKLMYKDESIYEDIGGSKKTIKVIDKNILKQATDHFYHPKNMILLITGNVDPEVVIENLKSHQFVTKTWPNYIPIAREVNITDKKRHHLTKINKKLDTNIIEVGIKIPEYIFSRTDLEHNIVTNPFFSMIFSPSSKLYKVLKKKKLYNFSFSASPVIEDDYGFFNISIETQKPKLFIKTIIELLEDLPELTFEEDIFKAYKRADVGRAIKAFDDVKQSHLLIKKLLNDNVNIYSFVERSKNITFDDFKVYQEIFTKNNIYLVEYLQ